MNKLLDTCILIDFSRGNPQAQTFMESLEVAPCLSALTVTEILAGVRNKREQSLFDNLFGLWEIFPVSAEIATVGGHFLNQYMKSHGTDLVDGIIAATAQVHGLEVITCNIKHFPMFPGLKAPY
ncbi:MAG: type II toxin-antitoxin system VapC family toxin [Thiothrix sp.]|jgi:predicted nucleic acid-binding protein|uniref:type II toxin-antitoxin system VapC family toxin n=1 Tax=Thiothrix sp. TaxID=1032 RepID=UPI00260B9D17|nr:type II toxin-antitoxin system VapC family toxin [Thiothrix sp.]MDD5392549.1 type II toxin-antitoxin system VapC family toxin [Thiothrix sp.]